MISIITPSYNQGKFLEATIRSVLLQSYPQIEYIIIDGGSTDNSLEIIKNYQKELSYWVSEPDSGQSDAINKGLRKSNGEILGWLNSDDILAPNAVSRAVDVFIKNPVVDVVHGRKDRIDADGKLIPTPKVPIDFEDFTPKNALCENYVNSAGAFWRRSIMEKVGYLDEDLHYVMDYEYWLRMIVAGANFRRIGGNLVAKFRVAEHAKTVSQLEQSALEDIAVLDRYLSDPQLVSNLGLSPTQLSYCAKKGRALRYLRAFYGCFRVPGRNRDALKWLIKAMRTYPPIILQRRWLMLGLRKIERQLSS